jgi:two-component system, OmpR family, response regulator MtrA
MDESIFVVEDDPSISETVALGLERAGYRVLSEADGRQALFRIREQSPDLVLLDLMLPSLDGVEVCRELRKRSAVPIIMLTAKSETVDVVAGLEVGADDYVTKPFEMAELVARVRSVLRRRTASGGTDERFTVGDLTVDPAAFRAFKRGEEVRLTATEFGLLLEMATHAGQVLTRDVLLSRVWDYDYLGDSRVVDMAVKRLRAKIEDDPSEPQFIKTVRGVGYRLERS